MFIKTLRLLTPLAWLSCLHLVATSNTSTHSESEVLVRKARYLPLIYPRTFPARLQFISGFGIPVDDLNLETVVTGYVFKASYYLPNRAKQLRLKNTHSINGPPDPSRRRQQPHSNATLFEQLLARSDPRLQDLEQDNKQALSSYRWAVYAALESLAKRLKLNGRECVLKSICESAAVPFDEHNGLLGELLHILLTPSSSIDSLSLHSDNDYLQAEQLGRAGTKCQEIYAQCQRSLLEYFSNVHTWGSDILKMLI